MRGPKNCNENTKISTAISTVNPIVAVFCIYANTFDPIIVGHIVRMRVSGIDKGLFF